MVEPHKFATNVLTACIGVVCRKMFHSLLAHMSVLPKRKRSMSHPKYFLPCTDPEHTFTLHKHLNETSQHIVLKALYTLHPSAPKRVVVKLYAGYESAAAEREYAFGEQLHSIEGFMPFLCKFTCNKRICDDRSGTPTTILVSKYTPSVRWNSLSIEALKSAILQTFAAILHAFDAFGFIHQDLHTSNVLLRRTRRSHVTIHGQHIETHGITISITDFELSQVTDKSSIACEQLIWDLDGFVQDLRAPIGAHLQHIRGFANITAVLQVHKDNAPVQLPWQPLERAIMSLHLG